MTATITPMTLNIREAARHTGISRRRIEHAVKSGELPSIQRTCGNRTFRRVLRSQLESWVVGMTEVPA